MNRISKCEVQKLFPILEAIKEGKTIQFKDSDGWRDINGDDEGFYLNTLVEETDKYRINPEPKYRSFKNAEECWNEMQKHQPFGVVKDKYFANYQTHRAFTCLITNGCVFGGYEDETFESCFKNLLFADGLPFGVKVDG